MVYLAPSLRRNAVAFLLYIAKICKAPPTTKYCSLCFFESRFLPRMESLSEDECKEALCRNKLNLYPLKACNLQILALVSFWIASKIHETRAVSVEQLRKLASSLITDQHFTKNDFIEAEIILMKEIKFDLRTGPLIFYALDDLLVKFRYYLRPKPTMEGTLTRKTARVGKLVKLQTCVTIIDLLYDLDPKDLNLTEISIDELSSAILAVAYILSVPIEKCNFPMLSWLSLMSDPKIQQSEIEQLTRKIFYGLFDEMHSKEYHVAPIGGIPWVGTASDQEIRLGKIQQSVIEDLTTKIFFYGLSDEMMDSMDCHPTLIEDIPCKGMTSD